MEDGTRQPFQGEPETQKSSSSWKGRLLGSHPCSTEKTRGGSGVALGTERPRSDTRMFQGEKRVTEEKSVQKTLLKQVSRLPYCWACQGFNMLLDVEISKKRI